MRFRQEIVAELGGGRSWWIFRGNNTILAVLVPAVECFGGGYWAISSFPALISLLTKFKSACLMFFDARYEMRWGVYFAVKQMVLFSLPLLFSSSFPERLCLWPAGAASIVVTLHGVPFCPLCILSQYPSRWIAWIEAGHVFGCEMLLPFTRP